MGIAPCTSGANSAETVLPVRNSRHTYCVSDYGWSDTWFFDPNISTYSNQLDVMSGDDAPNLRWDLFTGATGYGNCNDLTSPGTGCGWLGPSLDQGTLNPTSKNTNWSVVSGQGVHYVVPNSQAQSQIQHPDAMRITITTTANDLRAELRFDILNTSTTRTLTNLLLGDYFNFHTNGSSGTASDSNASRNQGIAYYLPGTDARCPAGSACIYTEGNRARSDFIADGRMWGSLITGGVATPTNPTNWMIGSAGSFNPAGGGSIPVANRVWRLTELNSYNNPAAGTSFGRGDAAGAFQWNLGSLAPGQTISFLITKELVELPEAATWQLLLLGLCGFLITRLRRTA